MAQGTDLPLLPAQLLLQLAYLSALGLTPAGAKKLDAAAAARTQEDPLVAALKNLSG